MTSGDFISIEEIVAEAASLIDDESFKKAGKSYYIMSAHRAVEELSIDTFYKKVTIDIFNWDECGDLKFTQPKNIFNIKEVYLFNSNCKESCSCQCNSSIVKSCWTSFAIAHFKRQYNTFGASGIATSKISEGNYDYINRRLFTIPCSIVYYGIQNDMMCFSNSAKGYKNLRIVANGFSSSNEDLPVIPRLARKAIVDYVKERVLYRIKHNDKQSRIDWADAISDLNGAGNKDGSWTLARRRLRMLDGAVKESMMDYLSGIDNK